MTTEQQKAIDKLRKLFALEKGAREAGSIAEADNAAAKARAMLLAYNLKESDIGEKIEHKFGKLCVPLSDLQNKNEGSNTVMLIVQVIAKNNLCDMIVTNLHNNESFPKDTGIVLIGSEVNTALVLDMVKEYVGNIRRIARKGYNTQIEVTNPHTWMRSFFQGAYMALKERFRQATVIDEPEIRSLVLDTGVELEKYIKDVVLSGKPSETKEVRGTAPGSSTAFQQGYVAGKAQSLSNKKALS